MLLKNKGVWKIIALLKHAQERKIYVTEKELKNELNALFKEDELDEILENSAFRKETFLETFKQYLIVKKFIDFYTLESKPGDLNKAFELYKNENKSIKINYVLYDVRNTKKDEIYFSRVSPKELSEYVSKTISKSNPKAKVKLRLFFYKYEDIKKTLPKPTESEKQKFYEENKETLFVNKTNKEGKEEKTYKPYTDPEVQKKIEDSILEDKTKEIVRKKVADLFEFLFTKDQTLTDYNEVSSVTGARVLESDYFFYDEFSSLGLGYAKGLTDQLSKAIVSPKYIEFNTDKASGYYQVVGKAKVKTPGYFLLPRFARMKIPPQVTSEALTKKQDELPKEIIKKTSELVEILKAKYAQELKSKGPFHELHLTQALKKEAFYKTLSEYQMDSKVESAIFKYDEDLMIKNVSFRQVTSKVKSMDIGESDYHCVDKPHYKCIIFIVEEKMDPDPKEFISKKDEYLEKSLFVYTKEQVKNIYLKTLMELANLKSSVPIDKNDKADDYGEFR
jgi:hypothetical protein